MTIIDFIIFATIIILVVSYDKFLLNPNKDIRFDEIEKSRFTPEQLINRIECGGDYPYLWILRSIQRSTKIEHLQGCITLVRLFIDRYPDKYYQAKELINMLIVKESEIISV